MCRFPRPRRCRGGCGTLRNVSTVAFLAGGQCTLTQSLKKRHTHTRTHVKKTVKPLNILLFIFLKMKKIIMFVC